MEHLGVSLVLDLDLRKPLWVVVLAVCLDAVVSWLLDVDELVFLEFVLEARSFAELVLMATVEDRLCFTGWVVEADFVEDGGGNPGVLFRGRVDFERRFRFLFGFGVETEAGSSFSLGTGSSWLPGLELGDGMSSDQSRFPLSIPSNNHFSGFTTPT